MRPIPVAFHIGPLVVHTYGIGLAVTFWMAYRYFERRLRTRGYPTDWVLGFFIWIVVSAVIGARVMHVLANLSYYQANPGQIIAIWHGGLSSWGGLILAVPTGIAVVRRRCPQLRLGTALDIVVPVLAAAWALGRLLGPQLMVAGGGHPTHQWFGMYYADQVGKRLPVPIFQAIEDVAVFAILLWVERMVRDAAYRRAGTGAAAAAAPDAGTDPATGTAATADPGTAAAAAAAAAAQVAYPAGAVLGVGMVLWGIERTVDQRLWLSYPGHLGSVLVQLAGLGLAVAGVVLLAVVRRRWARWQPPAPAGGGGIDGAVTAGSPGPDGAGATGAALAGAPAAPAPIDPSDGPEGLAGPGETVGLEGVPADGAGASRAGSAPGPS